MTAATGAGRAARPAAIGRARLSAVPADERRRLQALGRDGADHDAATEGLAILGEVLTAPPPAEAATALPEVLRVGAWNLQHCHWCADSAALLAEQQVDLSLLTELDVGMQRSGQLNTPAQIAERLGHGYGFAVEFVELLDDPAGGNRDGLHGNGFTAACAPLAVGLVRLGREADWFNAPRREQFRAGGRVAVMARFAWGRGELVAVAVHLESDTDAAGRARQMQNLLDAVDGFAGGAPVVIGGDFNAGARHKQLDYRVEGLFAAAEAHGYDWRGGNVEAPTSRKSRIPNALKQDRAHYDWFFTRGLVAADPRIVPAVDAQGAALSDHELITVQIRPA